MKAVHDNIAGPFAIEEDIALYGTITGGATLCTGRRFILHGTIAGDLRIEKGSRAILHGTVAGGIYNDGGRVELFGMACHRQRFAGRRPDRRSGSSRHGTTMKGSLGLGRSAHES
ncbi:hypothetical protein [Novosphingobium sp. Rr 2-17]|uniref:hypothetical protein n=1 Tax=Novosphingobium sp. Rr 2-17 TaxID=555793 RepID=UPI001ED8F5A0|nr:hypothetical protein [Novosphingobium sp. Rr 2-17]